MLILLTIGIVLAVGYAHFREGALGAFTHLVNSVIAGLVAFHFWPTIADELEKGGLSGYEDALALVGVFVAVFAILRVVTNALANRLIDIGGQASQIIGSVFGLITGYLAAGFLTCVLQTLPWQENFLGYLPIEKESLDSRVIPADQVYLRLMRTAHRKTFADYESSDRSESFEKFSSRFAKHRRWTETREPIPVK